MDLPPEFVSRMNHLLAKDAQDFLASYDLPVPVGLRANTLKLPLADLLQRLAVASQPVPWCASGVVLATGNELGRHPFHAAGLYYLQEPSAMVVGELAAPGPGMRVLDLSAAPGGKATHLASLMAGSGVLVANEVHPKRVWDLAENLERWGVRNAIVTNESPERLAAVWGGYFDRVIVDAPCSGEGMFRKSSTARAEWRPELPPGCAIRQARILDAAAGLVRPGGRLIYSTCTFAPVEDELQIARFLSMHPDFSIIASRLPGTEPGRPDWAGQDTDLAGCVRIWPHRAAGEGHFAAVLEKTTGSEFAVRGKGDRSHLPAAALAQFRRFVQEYLTGEPAGRLALEGSYLYADPLGAPPLSGLKVIHRGWWLGSLRPGRMEPSHALALGLAPQEAQLRLDLSAGDPGLWTYLRGEGVKHAGPDGWILVCVDGFSLGWGKRVQGMVKSHYPRGLRIQR
jgi:16S rRNA C967 or C1407 C5-methylase (RsmB/RsmF family)/NOL1/NOP2/fmu family ribosome biogenesis protein